EDFVPPEAHGAPMVGIVICWTGSHEEGERVVKPIREVAQPIMDMVGPIPYTALQSTLDGGGPKGTRGYMKAELMDEMTDEAIEVMTDFSGRLPGPMAHMLVESLGSTIDVYPEY